MTDARLLGHRVANAVVIRTLLVSVLGIASLSAGQRTQTFTGVITDSECAVPGHAQMRMGPTDAECTRLCVAAHGAEYVLAVGKDVYRLSDQAAPEAFAAATVRVVGTLDEASKTIKVESIAAAE